MHRIKSLFLLLFMTSLVVTVGYAASHLWREPVALSWWGVVLAAGAPMLFFARLMLSPVARTGAHLNWIPVAGTAGSVLAVLGDGLGLAAGLALANMLLLLAYIHWYSRFDARNNRAAAQLGLLAAVGLPMGLQALGYDSDVPMPTVLITAAGGQINYGDLTENYRIRPEPAAFMVALDRAGI